MKEFKVNDYITLKLIGGYTDLFVNGELFIQCKSLMLSIPIDKTSDYDEVLSIEEAAELSNRLMEGRDREITGISPETEFWAHCSNLQAWDEHNYDTRLLHSNIAFPLLRKLTEVGDQGAKGVFREEIAKRLESGYWPVIKFLVEGEFTDFLSREEFYSCILGYDDQAEAEITFLLEVEKLVGVNLDLERKLETQYGRDIKIENKRIIGFSFGGGLRKIPESIGGLKLLKEIYLFDNNIQELPNSIGNLENLEILDLSANNLRSLPSSFRNLKSLKVLDLSNNNFKEIPEPVFGLPSLEILNLEGNDLTSVPSSIESLKTLKNLNLYKNKLKNLPESIKNIEKLEVLNLCSNNFKEIPDCIYELLSLKVLELGRNKIEILQPEIKNLTGLKDLRLGFNKLKTLPKSICELKSLETLSLYENDLEDIPPEIANLNQLKKIVLRNNPRIMLSNEIKNKLKKIILLD